MKQEKKPMPIDEFMRKLDRQHRFLLVISLMILILALAGITVLIITLHIIWHK